MGNTCQNETESAFSVACEMKITKDSTKASDMLEDSEFIGTSKSPPQQIELFKFPTKKCMNPPSEKIFRIIRQEFRQPIINLRLEAKFKELPHVGPVEVEAGATYKGQMNRDQKHGFGEIVFSNGEMYEGYWEDGLQSGPGRFFYIDGNVYDGRWRRGKFSGQGRYYYSREEFYEGRFFEGEPHGVGKHCYPNGDYFEGGWLKGERHGHGVYFSSKFASLEPQKWEHGRLIE